MYYAPQSGLEGDILLFFCSPQLMTARVNAIRACEQQIFDQVTSLPSSQYSDAQALADLQTCCQMVRAYVNACPAQTTGVFKKLCTDVQATLTTALQARKQREDQEAQLRQPRCTQVATGVYRCNYQLPGYTCQAIATQGDVIWYDCSLATTTPPPSPGPIFDFPSTPRVDYLPGDPGPGGPPKYALEETDGGLLVQEEENVFMKYFPYVVIVVLGYVGYKMVQKLK
jgi:hypothetical protein